MVIATLKIDCESSEAGYLKGWMSYLASCIDDLLNCGLDVINQPIGTYHRIFITASLLKVNHKAMLPSATHNDASVASLRCRTSQIDALCYKAECSELVIVESSNSSSRKSQDTLCYQITSFVWRFIHQSPLPDSVYRECCQDNCQDKECNEIGVGE